PITWAEQLIESARAVTQPRLATLYVIASQCFSPGRIEEAVGYADAGQTVIGSGRYEVPFGLGAILGMAYVFIGQPERSVEWCRAQLPRGHDPHATTRATLTIALTLAGRGEEARAAANGLIDAAEATQNPSVVSTALVAYGFACRDTDPVRARDALRKGLMIAQDSGGRTNESLMAMNLARLEAEHGDTVSAFDHLTLAIRNFHNSGNTTTSRVPLAILAAHFDRLGRYEPAATIAGFAL